MHVAPYLVKMAVLAVGIAVGVAITFVIRPWGTAPASTSAAMPTPPDGNSAELGATLLQRVGRNLIADNRGKRPADGPMLFYATPKPFGETLCRVDVYLVAPKIIRGMVSDKERWDDDLKIETQYGLWKRPSAIGGDRDKACAAFRDFEHLIRDESILSAARGAFVMDTVLNQAKAGRFRFPVSCTRISMDPNAKPATCDPLAMLRVLTLGDLYQTQMKSELQKEHSSLRRDELLVVDDRVAKALKTGRRLFITIKVEDEQHFGRQSIDEAEVLSVEIEISEIY